MSEDTPNTFDKSAWLTSMLFETNRFGAAIADQAYLVRNSEEAREAWLRALRFPELVCRLTYDYDADEPIEVDPDEWWSSDMFQRAVGAELAAAEDRRIRREMVDTLVQAKRIVADAVKAAQEPGRAQNLERTHDLLEEAAVRLDCELAMSAPIGSQA